MLARDYIGGTLQPRTMQTQSTPRYRATPSKALFDAGAAAAAAAYAALHPVDPAAVGTKQVNPSKAWGPMRSVVPPFNPSDYTVGSPENPINGLAASPSTTAATAANQAAMAKRMTTYGPTSSWSYTPEVMQGPASARERRLERARVLLRTRNRSNAHSAVRALVRAQTRGIRSRSHGMQRTLTRMGWSPARVPNGYPPRPWKPGKRSYAAAAIGGRVLRNVADRYKRTRRNPTSEDVGKRKYKQKNYSR